MRTNYSPRIPLNQALFMAYQAKRDAEVAPGVGARFTDIAIIEDAECRFLDEKSLRQLRVIYEEVTSAREKTREVVESKVKQLELSWDVRPSKGRSS